MCPQIVVDYNAVYTEHWLYRWAEEVKPENCEFFRQPPAVLKDASGRYFVNPDAENLSHLADNYYQNMLAVASTEVIQTDLMKYSRWHMRWGMQYIHIILIRTSRMYMQDAGYLLQKSPLHVMKYCL